MAYMALLDECNHMRADAMYRSAHPETTTAARRARTEGFWWGVITAVLLGIAGYLSA